MTIALANDGYGTTQLSGETYGRSPESFRNEEVAEADRSTLLPAESEAKKRRIEVLEGEADQARSEDRRPPLVGQAHKGLILFVDDEEFIRRVVSALFTRAGYRIATAADGASGAAIFVKHSAEIALVITDSDMPVVNGEALGQIIRGFKPATKILSISGYPPGRRCSGVTGPKGADAFLPKPFNAQTLLDTVAGMLCESGDHDRPGGGAEHRRGGIQL